MAADTPQTPDPTSPRSPSDGVLIALAALGGLQLAWAIFQWTELIAHRAGEEAFCGIAALGDCTALWDSSFATSVQQLTRLPVAAWGVVWGLAATCLPLLGLGMRSSRRSLEPFWSGTVVTALAGLATVVVLLAASTQAGTFCSNCVGTYLLVLGFGSLTLFAAFKRGPLVLGRGLGAAVAPVAAGYLLALYPALQTPSASESLTALVDSGPRAEADRGEQRPEEPDEGLRDLLGRLEPPALQMLSNALDEYRNAPIIPRPPERGVMGAADAKVKLTEFVDLLCGHCANLHVQLEALVANIPPEVLSIESRYFPLDARCNPQVSQPQPPYTTPDTRCVAAKTMICSAGRPRAFELAGQIFRSQGALTPEGILAIAGEFIPQEQLQACVTSEETEKQLATDVQWAAEHEIRGTPLILLNGRKIPTNGALIYALLLAGGDVDHPAFAVLPPPIRQPEPGQTDPEEPAPSEG